MVGQMIGRTNDGRPNDGRTNDGRTNDSAPNLTPTIRTLQYKFAQTIHTLHTVQLHNAYITYTCT